MLLLTTASQSYGRVAFSCTWWGGGQLAVGLGAMTASPHRPGDDRFSVGVLVGGAGELSLAWRGVVQRVSAVSLARGDRCGTTYYP